MEVSISFDHTTDAGALMVTSVRMEITGAMVGLVGLVGFGIEDEDLGVSTRIWLQGEVYGWIKGIQLSLKLALLVGVRELWY